jgi:AcrR family transcriptional regulator
MSKKPRSYKDIEIIKNKILEASLEIISKEGFVNLSMRKIAAKTSMTAANIYNYYSGKDEIYLSIQTSGFIELYKRFEKIPENNSDSLIIIKKFMESYIEFGLDNSDLYEIMFTRNTPKYTDYIGTKLEPVAKIEKDAAMKIVEITWNYISKLNEKSETPHKIEPEKRTIQIWTALHGVVSLYNSRVLLEVDDNPGPVIDLITNDLMKTLFF